VSGMRLGGGLPVARKRGHEAKAAESGSGMTRPRTPYWRGLGWVLAFDVAAAVLVAAVVLGIGAGAIR
jgi:hypothetical protein